MKRRKLVTLVLNQNEGEDHPATWDWAKLLDKDPSDILRVEVFSAGESVDETKEGIRHAD